MPVKITGLKYITKKLNQIHQATSNMTPIFQQIGNMIKNDIDYNFENESSSEGKKWKDTKDNKRARGDKVLNKTSTLNRSFIDVVTNNSVEVGTNVPYAGIHQFGGKAGRNKQVIIPQRSYLPIKDDGELNDKLTNQIINYLSSSILGK